MPGLIEHQCSIGERGGFITRLRRGTYAPHIVEHIALELQTMIGHEVGYGRTRGGDVPGEYTLVFEHRHEAVGLRAAALALDVVQRAFAGTLHSVDGAVRELGALATLPDVPHVAGHVCCAVTGGEGAARAVAQHLLMDALSDGERRAAVIDVSPAFVLQAGLPYASSTAAIVLDTELTDVPERYRERDRAVRLLSTLADAVVHDGLVVCPHDAPEIQRYARKRGCRVGVCATGEHVDERALECACAVGRVREGRVLLEHGGDEEDRGPVKDDVSPSAQVAAALAAYVNADARAR
jgi:cyanophycin synthetase